MSLSAECYELSGLRCLRTFDEGNNIHEKATFCCTDYYDVLYCIHSLPLLISLKKLKPQKILFSEVKTFFLIIFLAQRRRKPNIGSALQSQN